MTFIIFCTKLLRNNFFFCAWETFLTSSTKLTTHNSSIFSKCRFLFYFSKKINEKTPPTSPSTPATTPSGHLRRWVKSTCVIDFHWKFIIVKIYLEIVHENHLRTLKVSRSRRQSRSQPLVLSPLPTRALSIWLRVATVHRLRRWTMRWRIPVSLRMLAKTPPRKRRPRSLKSHQHQPVHQVHPPCSINSLPAIFSRISSSKVAFVSLHVGFHVLFNSFLLD